MTAPFFDLEPVFATERLRFDLWSESDFADLYLLHADARVQVGYSAEPQAWTREGIRKRLEDYIEEQQRFGITKWKLSLADHTFVGRAGWSPWADGDLEIGYAITPEHQGRGYALEAAKGLIRWASDNRSERLVGFALTGNSVSRHVLEQSGMSYDEVKLVNGVLNAFYSVRR